MNKQLIHYTRSILVPLALCVFCSINKPPIAIAAPVPGYTHDLSHSRFKIGPNVKLEVDTPQFRRWRGKLGAWALDRTNNWSMGILDADAPRGPYILDENLQAKRVKDYFTGAGVPADQVRGVRAIYEVQSGAEQANRSLQTSAIKLDSIISILTRSVNGIPVPESFAWAKMTTSGDVDAECVFWPPIDETIIEGATSFAQRMSDPGEHAAYLARLPGHVYKDNGVVIHHTDPSVHTAPIAYVAYDVTLSPQGYATMRHFDENGIEFRLPQERLQQNIVQPQTRVKQLR